MTVLFAEQFFFLRWHTYRKVRPIWQSFSLGRSFRILSSIKRGLLPAIQKKWWWRDNKSGKVLPINCVLNKIIHQVNNTQATVANNSDAATDFLKMPFYSQDGNFGMTNKEIEKQVNRDIISGPRIIVIAFVLKNLLWLNNYLKRYKLL